MLRRGTLLAISVAAIAAVAAAWGPSLGYGLAYDDYLFSRPWRSQELQRVLHGTWDPTRVSAVFYRPLTSWFYALRFEVFGLNGFPQHLLSLFLLAVCSFLAGLFVWRECRSRRAAIVMTVAYAIHPAMAYAQAVWLTNQMHLLASALVLLGLLSWQWARSRGPAAWLLVLAFQLLTFGVKEDTVMLAPLLVVLTVLRRIWIGDIAWPHWAVTAAALVCPFGLFLFRYDVLGRFGGYGAWPGLETAWHNYARAFGVFTLEPARRPWQGLASTSVKALLVLGGLLSVTQRKIAYLFLVGLAVAAAFNLPFMFVTKVEQYHLVTLGAAFSITAAIEGAVSVFPWTPVRVGAGAACAIPLIAFVPLSRHMAADFSPCSPITLSTDAIVVDWPMVPPEVRDWLRRKPELCASGGPGKVTDAVGTATWAFWPEPGDDGQAIQWTSREATIMVKPVATRLSIAVRQPAASPDHPVTVSVGGATGAREQLTSGDWVRLDLLLSPSLLTRLRRMHRVELDVDPTFIPAQITRGSGDVRRLGVQLRVLGVE